VRIHDCDFCRMGVRRRCALAVHYRAIVEIRCCVVRETSRTVDVQVSVGMDGGVEGREASGSKADKGGRLSFLRK